MAWNEYSNLLKLEIERLKEENLKLRKDENY
jgi:FtsZ-binding cell division protein ZapB